MVARNRGILNALIKIDVKQFIDGKHNGNIVATVNIDLFVRFS